ncbi:MAG: dienelactone hydrolase family protein [Balneolaceae bacterium]|nr:dienelactone hydrolase family protein [Balneolaceae bacterium]MBO6545046.1 dienelactone hydrolase family protein [Balneolaceae bacterium]MBO6646442.1 dienelactone hydrolase family protein [Balneolaceae bacterium]
MFTNFYSTSFFALVLLVLSQNGYTQNFQEISFPSKDSLEITADLYHASKTAPNIILFHQSVSSRGEFRTIATELQELGFNCLAVDLRWGKQDFWNKVSNETARKYGTYEIVDNYERTEEYQIEKVWPVIWKAYDDMKASLEYINAAGYKGKTIVLGSSFSAMLVFKLAADGFPVDGIAAFSPGEYHPTDATLLSLWADKTTVPVYLSTGVSETEMVEGVKNSLPNDLDIRIHYSEGRHGASVLIQEEQDWPPFLQFLNSFKSEEVEIGFKLFELTRPSEKWDSTGLHKPIRAWYWHPSDSSLTNSPITYQEYIRQINPEKNTPENLDIFKRILSSLGSEDIPEESLNSFLTKKTNIHHNAPSTKDANRLVILSGAHPIYFSSLAEQIAKAGFSVLSVPRTGIRKGERLPFQPEGVQEYKLDLLAALEHLKPEKLIDTLDISFISWSFEGVPTLELAVELNTKSYLSLDSSIGYEYGEALLSDSVLNDIAFPVIHYTGRESGFGKSLELIGRFGHHINIVTDYNLTHGEFTSLRSATAPELKNEESSSIYMNLINNILNKIKK